MMRWYLAPRFWLALAVAMVLGAVLTLAALAREAGADRVTQTLAGNTSAIAAALRVPFERALDLGIDLPDQVGVEALLQEHLSRHRGVSFFAVTDDHATVIAFRAAPSLAQAHAAAAVRQARQPDQAGAGGFRVVRTPLQLPQDARPRGWLLTGYLASYIDQQVNAVVIDLLVAVLIAVILTLEVLRFAAGWERWRSLFQFRAFLLQVCARQLAVRSPLRGTGVLGRWGQHVDARLIQLKHRWQFLSRQEPPAKAPAAAQRASAALRDWGMRQGLAQTPRPDAGPAAGMSRLRMMVFLTALGDELVRPFMAVHASQLPGPQFLSGEALAGIALTTFLLTWALSQPFGAGLLQRHGARRCLGSATALAGGATLASAFASDWLTLTALRGLTGAGFGFVLIFSQILLLRLGRDAGRATAIAEFVGALVAAGICGPVIGGLMADKLGVTQTLIASALCAGLAMALALRQSSGTVAQSAPQHPTTREPGGFAGRRELLTLLLASAIPCKFVVTAVLLLLVPMGVANLGEQASVTGRLLLLYFLAYLLVSRRAGMLSDRYQLRKLFVVTGGLVSAVGCSMAYFFDGIGGLVATTLLLGLGQAWLASPQIVWATHMADHGRHGVGSERVLGLYRLVERFGGAAGPLLVAVLVSVYGIPTTLLTLSATLLLGSAVTVLLLREPPAERRRTLEMNQCRS